MESTVEPEVDASTGSFGGKSHIELQIEAHIELQFLSGRLYWGSSSSSSSGNDYLAA